MHFYLADRVRELRFILYIPAKRINACSLGIKHYLYEYFDPPYEFMVNDKNFKEQEAVTPTPGVYKIPCSC